MIEIQDLTVSFGATKAIDGLTARLDRPMAGLIGPNGAGKTTLVNVLSGFVTPSSGSVKVDGRDVLTLSTSQRVRAGLRRSFQTEQVVEDLTVWDNVLAILDHVSHAGLKVDEQVYAALEHTGLCELATRLGQDLNLFQRRMVEVAKSLVGAPKLILFDEPGAGLTEQESMVLRQTLSGIPARFGAQVLLIDHDVELISSICEQVLVLDFGRLLAVGPTQEVLNNEDVRRAYLGS